MPAQQDGLPEQRRIGERIAVVIAAVFAHDDCLALINFHALHVMATLPAVPIVRPVCERRDRGRQKTGGQGAGQNKSAIKKQGETP